MGCLQLIQYTTEFDGKTIKWNICTSQENHKALQENIQWDVYNSQIIQPDGILMEYMGAVQFRVRAKCPVMSL